MIRSEALDGWWHAYFDTQVDWQAELENPIEQTAHLPSIGWERLDDYKESTQVPGLWAAVRPGFFGVAWYWRPIVLPAGWSPGMVSLHIALVQGHTAVYLDQVLIGASSAVGYPFECLLDLAVSDEIRTLTLRVAYGDDTGGIGGSVTLRYAGCS